MKALFYKGEDITLTFKSTVSLAGYTKVVKVFTFGSSVKTATVAAVDNYTFTATIPKADTADIPAGNLNIVIEFTDGSGNKKISKSIECRISDAYVDGGERENMAISADIVFMTDLSFSVNFLSVDEIENTVSSHINNTTNPHGLTKAQIGIANVDNTSDASKPISAAVQTALDGKAASNHNHSGTYEASNTNIQSHVSSSSNPHSTTKSQVGLSNADNTSDVNKPVSTAQATAIATVQTTATSDAAAIVRLHNSSLVFQGFAFIATATPAHAVNYAWVCAESGTIFGLSVAKGQIIYSNGTSFTVESAELKNQRYYQTDYLTPGNNLYNKITAVSGARINYQTGGITADATFWYSDFIRIKPSTQYSAINGIRYYAFYNINRDFISGDWGIAYTVTSPANAYYIRFSHVLTQCPIANGMFNEGATALALEPFMLSVNGQKIVQTTGTSITDVISQKVVTDQLATRDAAIALLPTRTHLNDAYAFITEGANFATGATISNGYYLYNAGDFYSSNDYRATSKIVIPNGAKVKVHLGAIFVGALGVCHWINGVFIGGYNASSSIYSVSGSEGIFTFSAEEFLAPGTHEITVSGLTNLATYLRVYAYSSSAYVPTDNYGKLIDIPSLTTRSNVPGIRVYNSSGVEDRTAIGLSSAYYILATKLQSGHNIRFRFRITEDLIAAQKTAVIFSAKTISITAVGVALSQVTNTFTYESTEYTRYLPLFSGGVTINGVGVNQEYHRQIIGECAFTIRYAGTVTDDVTIENTGTEFIVRKNGTTISTISYATYSTMDQLFTQLKLIADIEVGYGGIDSRTCSELAKFGQAKLVSDYYDATNGYYRASAKFHIPYSVCDRWHEVEIVGMRGYTFVVIDGDTTKLSGSILYSQLTQTTELKFGGYCGVLFKDIEVDQTTSRDAEMISYNFNDISGTKTDMIISEFNPLILIWEGHDIVDSASVDVATHSGNISTTPDRIEVMASLAKSKGYVPVTLNDIRDYYHNGKKLPKRCYTMVFDDFQFDNYLNLSKRAVFTRNGIKPTLAVYNYGNTVTHNGQTITVQKAIAIGRNAGFGFVSHTHDHRRMPLSLITAYESDYRDDIFDGDIMEVDPSILVYPFGDYDLYLAKTLHHNGCALGIRVVYSAPNRRNSDPMLLSRIEIGLRTPISNVVGQLY